MSTKNALFYIQDSRSYVGNDVLWWAKDGKGYTTDLSKAETYTQHDAQAMHYNRISDIPWPKEYIDAHTRPAVDAQYINRSDALSGTGITITKPNPTIKHQCRCFGCGRLMSEAQFWSGECPHCGNDNRP